jgi:formamidopyrimidine-DNA glycosylase
VPELPEVETIRRQLQRAVKGARIRSVQVRFGKKLNLPARRFAGLLAGQTIMSVRRRAKLLLFGLSDGWTLAVHLKMTGRFLLVPEHVLPDKHTHVVFHLTGGRQLFFHDVRKFGFMKLVRTARLQEEILEPAAFGPEPLESAFTFRKFAMCLRGHAGQRVKQALLDQSCLAGIGNIYADEALWRAALRPDRRVKSLTEAELRRLYRGARQSLRLGVKHRGTSADDYLDIYGRPGDNAARLKAYGRAGERCGRCRGRIKKIKLGGRGTHFCPGCQK